MTSEPSEDPSSSAPATQAGNNNQASAEKISLYSRIKNMVVKPKNGSEGIREVLEEYIEELEEEDPQNFGIASHEQSLISNVLKLRKTTVTDVMIPRADIAAINVSADKESLMALLSEQQFSRIPVYQETLDDILGTVHIKDILSILTSNQKIDLKSLIRPVPIVSPSLPVLDLLLKMQSDKKHMVVVVDEYGGVDGLATIGDVIEAIVGEFDDEFDKDDDPQMIIKPDGSVIADSRVYIEEFEKAYGKILSEEERAEVDTLGGLVFFTASRIPARGEVIKHDSGMVFEILDADQRRINSLRIRNIPEFEKSE